MAWAFDVRPTIVDGRPYIPDANDFTTGLVSAPANLKYRLVPRSDHHKFVVMAEAKQANQNMTSLDGSPSEWNMSN